MSSAVDIQIVSPPNLEKIENFFKDASYRETIEFSANFNTRLGLERRLRLPFLDPQTGVAQNHSQLFMDKRHRMPGFRQGQIYTYPAARWRKSRRQYLNKIYRFPERPFQALRKEHEALTASNASGSNATLNFHLTNSNPPPAIGLPAPQLDMDYSNVSFQDESCSLGAIGGDTSDSKDSQQQQHQHQHQHQQQQQQQQQHQQQREELPKEWFYDEMDMQDMDSLEDPKSPADDEYDYDPRYGTKKRRKRAATRKRNSGEGGSVGRRRRNRADTSLDASMESVDGSLGGMESVTTPTKSGRRPRGSGGPRGRRRTKNLNTNNGVDPPSPGMHAEPPSFDSVAAAVGGVKYM